MEIPHVVWICIIVPLAVYRLSILIVYDKISEPIRRLFGEKKDESGNIYYPDKFLPNLIRCYNCVSVWMSLFCLLIYLVYPYILLPIFFSGMAVLVEGLSG